MRTFLIAVLLSCAAVSSAMAQPGPGRGDRGNTSGTLEAAPTPTLSYSNICLTTELIDAPVTSGYFHSFFFRDFHSIPGQVDITADGLKLHSPTSVASFPGTVAADTRFNGMIETLRAAAASRSRVTFAERGGVVVRITVFWNQRCE